jgi:hypothetical protein
MYFAIRMFVCRGQDIILLSHFIDDRENIGLIVKLLFGQKEVVALVLQFCALNMNKCQ